MPRIIEPEYLQQQRYVDAVSRGESGLDLARSAGIPVNQGSTPPVVYPPSDMKPNLRMDSSANYVRPPVGGGSVEDMWNEIQQTYGNLPIDQAQKGIAVALQFQSDRGFRQDIASGMEPAQAAMKWAPYMNKDSLSGITTMIKAQQAAKAKPNWVFTPGTNGAPDAWIAPGERPLQIKPPTSDFRKPMHEPGVGIFEYNPETKAWEKSVGFPSKPERYSTKKVEIDPATGEITTISGDPSDPEIKKLMEDIKTKKPTESAWPIANWLRTKLGISSPAPAPTQFPFAMTNAPAVIPTNAPAPSVQAPASMQSVAPTNAPAIKRLRYDPVTKTLNAVQ